MQALQIDAHGPPDALAARDVPTPVAGADEVRIAIRAAAVNPSDVMSAGGRFPHSPLPRVLGRDFAGRVESGPAELVGAEVWGSGGDLGISRDGAHAEYLVLPVGAVSRRPAALTAEEAAAAGVPFVTAWSALVDVGRLAAGEWVVVSGAAGAVGGAAVQVAAALGARVVALVRDADEAERVGGERVAAVARSDRDDLVGVVRHATGGRGADLALDGVGGVIFQPLFDALADGGRMAVYSAAGGREALLDLFALYRRRLAILGVNTAVVDAVQSARILGALAPLFESGKLRPLPVVERYALSDAARAYARVANGAPGKVVLVPDRLLDGAR
ncbi:MAG TPA: zinc-binding alcohol dehydrogenase family protein [Gemmatimonadaceae bacterium]